MNVEDLFKRFISHVEEKAAYAGLDKGYFINPHGFNGEEYAYLLNLTRTWESKYWKHKESDMALEVGDLVNLKSGGPCMTVVAIEGTNYRCNWFSADTYEMLGGAVHHGTFPEGSLERWEEESEEEAGETEKKFGS